MISWTLKTIAKILGIGLTTCLILFLYSHKAVNQPIRAAATYACNGVDYGLRNWAGVKVIKTNKVEAKENQEVAKPSAASQYLVVGLSAAVRWLGRKLDETITPFLKLAFGIGIAFMVYKYVVSPYLWTSD